MMSADERYHSMLGQPGEGGREGRREVGREGGREGRGREKGRRWGGGGVTAWC